jgi:hypothetical protein
MDVERQRPDAKNCFPSVHPQVCGFQPFLGRLFEFSQTSDSSEQNNNKTSEDVVQHE